MFKKIFQTVSAVALAIAAFTLAAPAPAIGQAVSSLVTTRITQPIDDSSLVTLHGTVHALANKANDRGAAPASMPLERIQVVLKRSDAQESALKQLISDMHTPGTASYHKWLTPTQFGQQFGPSDQDVATLEAWLESKGFSVTKINPGKQTLEMTGNAGQFNSAFHTQIHKYVVNGETHYANAADPQIPAALAPVFGGFTSLSNFRGKNYIKVLGKATYDPTTDKATPLWTIGPGSPAIDNTYVVAPGDFAVQYDLNPLYTAGTKGAGQTIAIINDSNINVAIANQYRTLFGLPANPPQVIVDGNDPGIDGINDPDGPNYDSVEAYLDVEEAGAVAPAATVDLVVAADTSLQYGLLLAAERAVYSNIAPVISMSFGLCEASSPSLNATFNSLWEQAAAQGITVLVSSGDSGSAACDDGSYYAVYGQNITGWGESPYNVSVGGTDFYYSSWNSGTSAINTQLGTYWNTAVSNQVPATTLKSTIPEQPWNDSQYGLNIFSLYSESGGTETSIAGGGGGASNCATLNSSNNCVGYPKPSWQKGTGVPADSARDVPDVALFAANGFNASYYPECWQDGDCQPASGTNLVQITGIGGTSASSPAFAGLMALVNEKYGRQGQADFVLYPLATQFPAAFHDVTNGSNSVPCNVTESTGGYAPTDCISVSNAVTITDPTYGTATEGQIGSGTTPEYNATAGYDLASGLGSVDANNLVTDWNKVTFASSTTTLTPSSTSFAHGTAVTVSGTVTGTGTPSGQVALMTDSTEPTQQGQTNFTLSSGSYSGSVSYLPGGTYNIWGQYSGDGTNGASTSQKTQITVSPEASTTSFTVNDVGTGYGAGPAISPGANVPYGTQLILAAIPYGTAYYNQCVNVTTPPNTCGPVTPATGTVTFKDGSSTLNTAVLNAEGDAEYNAPWAVGSHSATASYSGDASYNASTASAIAFTITKDTPSINAYSAIATTSDALVGGQATVFTIQILNSANLTNESSYDVGYSNPTAPPTGTVTISGFPAGVPTSATLQPGVDGDTYSAVGIATITIPASTPAGTYSVTISYPGDSNYTSASTQPPFSIPIQNVGGTATTTVATITGSVSPTTSVTVAGTVTGKSGSGAPSNTGGGVLIYSSGYIVGEVGVTQASSDTSTFSAVLNSQSLLQGSNAITVQYLGDATYAPSADVISMPISNPLSDFTMVANSTIIPVTEGTTATGTVQIASANGFAGTVTIACAPASGITCTPSTTSQTLTSGQNTSFMVSLSAAAGATIGPNDVLITATAGKFTHTLGLNAIVSAGSTAPGFTLANGGAITVAAGSSGNTTLTVTPTGGFTGNVNFSCAITSSPSGATSPPTCSAPAADVTGTAAVNSTLTAVTTSSTTTGAYTATVTASDAATGTITATTTVNITVTNAATASFTLGANPTTLTLAPGASGTSTITVTPNGFTGMVNFTCVATSSPSGAIDPPSCTAPAANVTSSTTPVTSTLTVTTTGPITGALKMPLSKFFEVGGGVAVAGLFFFGIPARRRKWRAILGLILLAGMVGLGIGCGSGSSGGGGGNGGTTAGSYTLTVTGADAATGKITTTTTVTLTVQ